MVIFYLNNPEKNRSGGGIMIGIDQNLSSVEPVIIYQGEKEIEIMVIEISLSSMKLRVMTAYGPQENSKPEIIDCLSEIRGGAHQV